MKKEKLGERSKDVTVVDQDSLRNLNNYSFQLQSQLINNYADLSEKEIIAFQKEIDGAFKFTNENIFA